MDYFALYHKPAWLGDYVARNELSDEEIDVCQFALHTTTPTSYKEASESHEWQKATEAELEAISRNNT